MNKTAVIAFPVTVLLAWILYVVTRTGNGPGLKWNMVANNLSFTFSMVGVLYVLFVLITLTTLYFTAVRGASVSAMSVLGSAFVRLMVVFVIAIPIGGALGECYTYIEERAFRREAAQFMATTNADPRNGDRIYSRKRWWPGSSQILVSDSLN